MKIGKVFLFLLIGVAAYFIFKKFYPGAQTDNSMQVFGNSTKEADQNVTVASVETKAPANGKPKSRTFTYSPEKPQNGKVKGVVELGAAGFNSFVINMDRQKRWEIISKDFGESLAYEGLATADDIHAGLKRYITEMFDKGVSKNDMHFVISSGAQKEPKTGIIIDDLKKIGFVVNLVTPEKEGEFGYKATVPEKYQDNSFMVDIGSGTTKISWKEGNGLKTVDMPGAKYFEKGMGDEDVFNQVKARASTVPQSKREMCFILGGVPFTLAKQERNGNERYTILNRPDAYTAKDKKTEAGLNIYRAINEATQTKTVVFDWDSNFTIGFLLSLRGF
jgi:hypothetical protein